MNNDAKVLITGGGGLIGGHLVRQLLNNGNAVTVLDSAAPADGCLPYLGVSGHPRLTYVQGSVTDAAAWARLPKDFQYVVHAAAILGIERVPREQIETMDVTIAGTEMALQYARECTGLARFVFLSTSEIYGVSAQGVDEQAPAVIEVEGGRWCYASAKITAEFYVKAFAERFGFAYTIVRPFNVYGPAFTCSGALTTITRRAVAGEPIIISGTGKQTRSWCHVQDFTDGMIQCLFASVARNETFNLGHDMTEVTLLQLAELIRETTGTASRIVIQGRTGQDVFLRRPDLAKARRLIGFRPQIGLREGIEDIAAWVRATAAAAPARAAGKA